MTQQTLANIDEYCPNVLRYGCTFPASALVPSSSKVLALYGEPLPLDQDRHLYSARGDMGMDKLDLLKGYEVALIDRVVDGLYDHSRNVKQCAEIVAAISQFCQEASSLIIQGDAVAGQAVTEGLMLICGRLLKNT